MATSGAREREAEAVRAVNVRFQANILHVLLSDGREIALPVDRVEWLRWLANAKPDQRAKCSIEPGGFAIYWDELDDGIEVATCSACNPFREQAPRTHAPRAFQGGQCARHHRSAAVIGTSGVPDVSDAGGDADRPPAHGH